MSINVNVWGESLENVSHALTDAQAKLARQHPEMIRQVGVAILNVANRATPPNPGARSMRVKQSGYGQQSVKALKMRIAAEITGVEKIKPSAGDLPSAKFAAGGWGRDYQGPDAWGGYGFRALKPSKPGAKLPRVKYTDPEQVLRHRRFRRRGNVVRAMNGQAADGARWVKPKDLLAAVRRRQERAGRLITSWLPAAQALGASNAARDYAVSKHRAPGGASLSGTSLWVALDLSSDWGGTIVARRYAPHFLSMVEKSSSGVVKNTMEKFVKNLFK